MVPCGWFLVEWISRLLITRGVMIMIVVNRPFRFVYYFCYFKLLKFFLHTRPLLNDRLVVYWYGLSEPIDERNLVRPLLQYSCRTVPGAKSMPHTAPVSIYRWKFFRMMIPPVPRFNSLDPWLIICHRMCRKLVTTVQYNTTSQCCIVPLGSCLMVFLFIYLSGCQTRTLYRFFSRTTSTLNVQWTG